MIEPLTGCIEQVAYVATAIVVIYVLHGFLPTEANNDYFRYKILFYENPALPFL